MVDSNNDSSKIKLLESQLSATRRELNNLRQQLNTLKHVHRKECEDITNRLLEFRCDGCLIQRQDEVPSTSQNNEDLLLIHIGNIRTQFPEKRGTPRQPGVCLESVGQLILNNNVFTNPDHSLEGLQDFSHMWILFHFHKNDSTHVRAKVAPPRLNGLRKGVFSTRSPHRPNAIGLSLVKIDRIINNVIFFSGVDMIDGTPVLDIKPYIPKYDAPNYDSRLYYPEDSLQESDDNVDIPTSQVSSEEINFSELVSEIGHLNARYLDGEENEASEAASAQHTTVTHDILDLRTSVEENFHRRPASRIGEREAPDGEEEEPAGTVQVNMLPTRVLLPDGDDVRVPAWIDEPPISRLTVLFKDRAVAQLLHLGDEESEARKRTIISVLQEDPRSVYLRERYGSQCYVFRIAELYVSCRFNDESHIVTVFKVFQNTPLEDGD